MKTSLKFMTSNALLMMAALFSGGCTPEKPENTTPPEIAISYLRSSETSITAGFKPNETVASYLYAIGTESDAAAFENGSMGGCTVVETGESKSVTFEDLVPETEYTIFARATDKKGVKGGVSTLTRKTQAAPTPVVTISTLENAARRLSIKFSGDKNTARLSYAIGLYSDLAAFEAGTLEGIRSADCNSGGTVDIWSDLEAGKEYVIFARGENKYGKKGATKIVKVKTFDPNIPVDRTRCVGYLPTWNYACYNTMDWSALTHINIAFYYPDSAGNMNNPFGNDQTLKSIVDKAHANGVKVLASIRDCNAALFATGQTRAAFIAKIMAHVDKFNLDGIDSDLEKNEADFWKNYEYFISDLRSQCTEKGLLLTTAVSTWFSNNITDKTFACFDFINIMAYDLGFANHSPFDGMKNMAEHYKNRGLSADRIVCGVPFYGYDKNSTGWGEGQFSSKAYREILAIDPLAADKDESGVFVYNGRPTIKQKSEFARDYGGIMIWELSQDVTGANSLLGVIKQNLFRAGTAPRPVTN